jgi:hypothetical protein
MHSSQPCMAILHFCQARLAQIVILNVPSMFHIRNGLWIAFLLCTTTVFAQKVNSGQSSSPGKASVKSESSSSPSSNHSESSRPRGNSSESSSSSYSEPAPQPRVEPQPVYVAPVREDSYQAEPTYAAPKPSKSSIKAEEASVGAGYNTVNAPQIKYSAPSSSSSPSPQPDTEALLPGIKPVPLPMPLDPPGSRDLTNPHGTLTTLDDDPAPSTPPLHIGTVLTAPARPNYQTLGFSAVPITQITPVKPPVIRPKPTTNNNSGQNGGGGTGNLGGTSDPYYPSDNTNTDFNATTSSYSAQHPALGCIYDQADILSSMYSQPSWCTSNFDRDFGMYLGQFERCYQDLPGNLVEPWMWESYLTYLDERNFWSEECYEGDPQLKTIRDFMREKALWIPYLLIEVDATSREDWMYVDTAFAAPYGGKGYFDAMSNFEPDLVLRKLQSWLNVYPVILQWPSYGSLQQFYANYFRSDIASLLRAKARADYHLALGLDETAHQQSLDLLSNAAWLCLAMLQADHKAPELSSLLDALKPALRKDAVAWAANPLRNYLK